jgi:hypothetical protein
MSHLPCEEQLGSSLGSLGRGWACLHGPARGVRLDNRAWKPGQGASGRMVTCNNPCLTSTVWTRKPAIACGEQPQQRFETYGAGALSDTELIALLLHSGIQGHSVLQLASQLIAQAGSLAGLASWQPADFQWLKGIGRSKARQLAALTEIGRRMMKPATSQAPCLNRPELIAPIVRGLAVEKFWVACLNRKNRLKKWSKRPQAQRPRRHIPSGRPHDRGSAG